VVSFETDVIDRLARIEEHVTSVKARADDHETRLRSIEIKQWALAGVTLVFSPVLAKLGLHFPSSLT